MLQLPREEARSFRRSNGGDGSFLAPLLVSVNLPLPIAIVHLPAPAICMQHVCMVMHAYMQQQGSAGVVARQAAPAHHINGLTAIDLCDKTCIYVYACIPFTSNCKYIKSCV